MAVDTLCQVQLICFFSPTSQDGATQFLLKVTVLELRGGSVKRLLCKQEARVEIPSRFLAGHGNVYL